MVATLASVFRCLQVSNLGLVTIYWPAGLDRRPPLDVCGLNLGCPRAFFKELSNWKHVSETIIGKVAPSSAKRFENATRSHPSGRKNRESVKDSKT